MSYTLDREQTIARRLVEHLYITRPGAEVDELLNAIAATLREEREAGIQYGIKAEQINASDSDECRRMREWATKNARADPAVTKAASDYIAACIAEETFSEQDSQSGAGSEAAGLVAETGRCLLALRNAVDLYWETREME